MELNNEKIEQKVSPEKGMDDFFCNIIEEGLLTYQQLIEVEESSEGLTIWDSLVAPGLLPEEDYARLMSKSFGFQYICDVFDEHLSEVIFDTVTPISKTDLFSLFKSKMFVPIFVNNKLLFLVQHNQKGYETLVEQQIKDFAISSKATILKTIERYELLFPEKN